MNTALGERLNDLAVEATAGLEVRNPAYRSAPTNTARIVRPALALAAMVIVILGAWSLRDTTDVVDVTGRPEARALPALLHEEPTPLSDLPAEYRTGFEDVRVRPFGLIAPDTAPVTFPGVHVVNRDDLVILIGLDDSGTTICMTTIAPDGASGSSCTTTSGLARAGSMMTSLTAGGTHATVLFVLDEVAAAELGANTYPAERNVIVIDETISDVVMLRNADGTAMPEAPFPMEDAVGALNLPGQDTLDLVAVGCATTRDGTFVESAFSRSDTLVTAVVAPTGVFLTGGLGGDPLEIVAEGAHVETSLVDGTLVVEATWDNEDGSGGLRVDCGERHLDVTDLRP